MLLERWTSSSYKDVCRNVCYHSCDGLALAAVRSPPSLSFTPLPQTRPGERVRRQSVLVKIEAVTSFNYGRGQKRLNLGKMSLIYFQLKWVWTLRSKHKIETRSPPPFFPQAQLHLWLLSLPTHHPASQRRWWAADCHQLATFPPCPSFMLQCGLSMGCCSFRKIHLHPSSSFCVVLLFLPQALPNTHLWLLGLAILCGEAVGAGYIPNIFPRYKHILWVAMKL